MLIYCPVLWGVPLPGSSIDPIFYLWVYDLESGYPVGKTHTHILLKDARPRGVGVRWNSESILYLLEKKAQESMTKKKKREKTQFTKIMNERGAINIELTQVKKNYKGILYTLMCQQTT